MLHDSGEEVLTLNFSVCRIYTVIVNPNPGWGFHGASEASDIWEVYARLGARFDDSLAAHNWKW
jgi:hypothetical protein